jgi:hypothetical protein
MDVGLSGRRNAHFTPVMEAFRSHFRQTFFIPTVQQSGHGAQSHGKIFRGKDLPTYWAGTCHLTIKKMKTTP